MPKLTLTALIGNSLILWYLSQVNMSATAKVLDRETAEGVRMSATRHRG